MRSRIVIERAWLSHDGRRINYAYEGVGESRKFFAGRPPFYAEYDVDLRAVHESILMIPLVANLAPIAWFSGVPLDVPTLDDRFTAALAEVKATFMEQYPGIVEEASPLHVRVPFVNTTPGSRHAMLFSGGVDAYATFFRHRVEGLDLVSIRGADIPVDDSGQWQALVDSTSQETVLLNHPKRLVEANLRDFYTYQVNMLVPTKAWWGLVQHGLALLTLVAPLSAKLGYSLVYIASTHTEAIKVKWGSSPEIDNQIAWADATVHHDGYDMNRMDKIHSIVAETARSGDAVNLRVCYSERNKSLNCSRCEKCLRTILGLSLSGADPNGYGFIVGEDAYDTISDVVSRGFATEGVRHLWWQLHQRMRSTPQGSIHLLGNSGSYQDLQELLAAQLKREIQPQRNSAAKMAAIERFPRLFQFYLKLRRRFS